MITKAIRNILVNNANLIAITGNIYPETIPQDAEFPAIFYQVISRRPTKSKTENCGLDFYIIRFTSYSESYSQVAEMEQAIIDALDFYPRSEILGVKIDSITYDSSPTGGYSSDARAYQKVTDFEAQIK